MKEDIKAEWKKNLRSGKFAQGSGQLRTWDPDEKVWKYCCLGLLCEMSGLGEWKDAVSVSDGYVTSTYLYNRDYLPVAVAEWAGIDPRNDEETGVQQRLGAANDEEGSSFFEIANLIDTMQDL
jgi:hypothetical protein